MMMMKQMKILKSKAQVKLNSMKKNLKKLRKMKMMITIILKKVNFSQKSSQMKAFRLTNWGGKMENIVMNILRKKE